MPRERPGPDAQSIKSKRVAWSKAWRIIASRYPPIHLFERLSNNPLVWDALIALEGATNPRVRDEVGEINLVPGNRRVVGPNASYVMAPFTHVNPKGSRFSNGTYGVYYAASSLETAIRETAYHFARIAADAKDFCDGRICEFSSGLSIICSMTQTASKRHLKQQFWTEIRTPSVNGLVAKDARRKAKGYFILAYAIETVIVSLPFGPTL